MDLKETIMHTQTNWPAGLDPAWIELMEQLPRPARDRVQKRVWLQAEPKTPEQLAHDARKAQLAAYGNLWDQYIRQNPTRRRQTAFHESGHAIAALVLWGHHTDIEIITLCPDGRPGDPLGYVKSKDSRFAKPAERLVAWLAGPIASQLAGLAPYTEGDWNSYQNDLADAKKATGQEFSFFELVDAWDRAHAILKNNWRAVEATAAALESLGSLTGQEFKYLVQSLLE
jgi:hypothetical protein